MRYTPYYSLCLSTDMSHNIIFVFPFKLNRLSIRNQVRKRRTIDSMSSVRFGSYKQHGFMARYHFVSNAIYPKSTGWILLGIIILYDCFLRSPFVSQNLDSQIASIYGCQRQLTTLSFYTNLFFRLMCIYVDVYRFPSQLVQIGLLEHI